MRVYRLFVAPSVLAWGCDEGSSEAPTTAESEIVARLLPGYQEQVRVEVIPAHESASRQTDPESSSYSAGPDGDSVGVAVELFEKHIADQAAR